MQKKPYRISISEINEKNALIMEGMHIQTEKQKNKCGATRKQQGESEFYLPHRPLTREAAESTKMQIVFDILRQSKSD